MTTPTYELIERVTSSAVASVTFSSIPQTYRDLVILLNGESINSSAGYFMARINGASSNYSYVEAWGRDGSPISAGSTASGIVGVNGGPPFLHNKTFLKLDFLDYSVTDKHKSILVSTDESPTLTGRTINRYASTAAVSSIELFPSDGASPTGYWISGSVFSLYGIAG